MTCQLDHRAIDRELLATPCFRCGAPAGQPCRTDPGAAEKRDPYTGKVAWHQRRMNTMWNAHGNSGADFRLLPL